jgi:hypothetical protein
VAIGDEANKVPGAHAALLDVVKSVSNTFDEEAYARLLAREDVRADFMVVSRSSLVRLPSLSRLQAFAQTTKPELLKRLEDDLGRFTSLRAQVSLRYAESVDWSARMVRGLRTSFATIKIDRRAMRGRDSDPRTRTCRSARFPASQSS